MTLSKVDDEATSFFMTNFYEHLFSGEDKHSAYKAAINTMRNSEKYSDPKYWSSFILVDQTSYKVSKLPQFVTTVHYLNFSENQSIIFGNLIFYAYLCTCLVE